MNNDTISELDGSQAIYNKKIIIIGGKERKRGGKCKAGGTDDHPRTKTEGDKLKFDCCEETAWLSSWTGNIPKTLSDQTRICSNSAHEIAKESQIAAAGCCVLQLLKSAFASLNFWRQPR